MVVETGQTRKIRTVVVELGAIMGSAVRQRNGRAAAHVEAKKSAAKIGNFQTIVGEKKFSGDLVEGQSLAQKNVIHPGRRIDIDLKSRSFAVAKLIDAVRRDCRRLTKFVRRNVFREIGIDP